MRVTVEGGRVVARHQHPLVVADAAARGQARFIHGRVDLHSGVRLEEPPQHAL